LVSSRWTETPRSHPAHLKRGPQGMRFCPKDGSLLDAVAKRSTQGLTSTEFCCRVCKCAVAPCAPWRSHVAMAHRYSEDLKRPLVDTTVLTPKRAEGALALRGALERELIRD